MKRFSVLFLICLMGAYGQHPLSAAAVSPIIRVSVASGLTAVDIGLNEGASVTDELGNVVAQYSGEAPVIQIGLQNRLLAAPGGSLSPVFFVRTGSSGLLRVNNRPYRGVLLIRASGDTLEVINAVLLEDYLRGVLPHEVSPAWPVEALRAQAVAARTYAAANLGRHGNGGFDLCSGVHCQVYGGAGSESTATDNAINETRSVVAVFRSKPIAALYHAASGGHTEDAANVWQWDVPYLQGVPDTDPSPYARWVRTVTARELDECLRAAGYDIGQVDSITPTRFGKSGRVAAVVLAGAAGRIQLSGEQFRQVLGLRSTCFSIAYLPDRPAGAWLSTGIEQIPPLLVQATRLPLGIWAPGFDPPRFVLLGRGWGHGVGMSQWGAMDMALRGHTYQQILKYYYQGIELVKWFEDPPAGGLGAVTAP